MTTMFLANLVARESSGIFDNPGIAENRLLDQISAEAKLEVKEVNCFRHVYTIRRKSFSEYISYITSFIAGGYLGLLFFQFDLEETCS